MTDELKPVPCGCGGEAKVDWTVINGAYMAGVVCQKCGTKTPPVWRRDDLDGAKAKAITTWNRAMGERTAKVKTALKRINGSDQMITVTSCSACENVVSIFDNYCPGCGAHLEWE